MKNILFILIGLSVAATVNAQSFAARTAAHIEKYKAAFLTEGRSPLKAEDLKDLHFYPADSTVNIVAAVKLLEDQKPFKMPTYAGTTQDYIRYAVLEFPLYGKPQKLTLYKSIALAANPLYKDHLFLPFTDETNGRETYGGGRYIDLNKNDITDGKILLDFNKAYNPYCAYSDGYRCPIPPQENELQLEVKAGEKKFTGNHKKM